VPGCAVVATVARVAAALPHASFGDSGNGRLSYHGRRCCAVTTSLAADRASATASTLRGAGGAGGRVAVRATARRRF